MCFLTNPLGVAGVGVQPVASSTSANMNPSQTAADVFMKGVFNFVGARFNQDTSVTHFRGPSGPLS